MYSIIEGLIKIVFFCFALYGLWRMVSPFLQGQLEFTFRNWKRKRKIRRLHDLNHHITKSEKEKPAFIQHLELLLNSVSKSEKNNVMNFLILTSLIFMITFIVLINLVSDLIISLLISFLFAALPYFIIRFRLITLRLRTQFSFLTEYHKIVQLYQSTGRDIYYTIMNVVKETDDKILKRTYMKLLSSLQKARSDKEFAHAVMLFSYSINSTFSKRFAKLLMKAHIERVDITLSLMDLNKDIKKRKQDMQTEKTNKLETVLMGYLPIPLFPLLIFCAYRIAGVRDFWFYFQQKSAITVFVIAFVCSVIYILTAYVTTVQVGS